MSRWTLFKDFMLVFGAWFLAYTAGFMHGHSPTLSATTSLATVAIMVGAAWVIVLFARTIVSEMKMLPPGKVVPARSLWQFAQLIAAGALVGVVIAFFWNDPIVAFLKLDASKMDATFGAFAFGSLVLVYWAVFMPSLRKIMAPLITGARDDHTL